MALDNHEAIFREKPFRSQGSPNKIGNTPLLTQQESPKDHKGDYSLIKPDCPQQARPLARLLFHMYGASCPGFHQVIKSRLEQRYYPSMEVLNHVPGNVKQLMNENVSWALPTPRFQIYVMALERDIETYTQRKF